MSSTEEKIVTHNSILCFTFFTPFSMCFYFHCYSPFISFFTLTEKISQNEKYIYIFIFYVCKVKKRQRGNKVENKTPHFSEWISKLNWTRKKKYSQKERKGRKIVEKWVHWERKAKFFHHYELLLLLLLQQMNILLLKNIYLLCEMCDGGVKRWIKRGDKWMWEGEIECYALWWSPDCVGSKWTVAAAMLVQKWNLQLKFMVHVHTILNEMKCMLMLVSDDVSFSLYIWRGFGQGMEEVYICLSYD